VDLGKLLVIGCNVYVGTDEYYIMFVVDSDRKSLSIHFFYVFEKDKKWKYVLLWVRLYENEVLIKIPNVVTFTTSEVDIEKLCDEIKKKVIEEVKEKKNIEVTWYPAEKHTTDLPLDPRRVITYISTMASFSERKTTVETSKFLEVINNLLIMFKQAVKTLYKVLTISYLITVIKDINYLMKILEEKTYILQLDWNIYVIDDEVYQEVQRKRKKIEIKIKGEYVSIGLFKPHAVINYYSKNMEKFIDEIYNKLISLPISRQLLVIM